MDIFEAKRQEELGKQRENVFETLRENFYTINLIYKSAIQDYEGLGVAYKKLEDLIEELSVAFKDFDAFFDEGDTE
jgi:hypothetical protein